MSNTNTNGGPTGQNANQRAAPLLAAIDLRDYFAGKAMQRMLACETPRVTEQEFAERAYAMADAMLKARGDTP